VLVLGTPSTLVGTNITGTASALNIGGNAATATNVTGTVAVANGGTGLTSPGAAGSTLRSDGTECGIKSPIVAAQQHQQIN
jgi:hypothetical protein